MALFLILLLVRFYNRYTAFDPTDDSVYEGNETAIVAITGVSGGSATENGTQSETITITENEAAPTVTLSTSASSINVQVLL